MTVYIYTTKNKFSPGEQMRCHNLSPLGSLFHTATVIQIIS